MLQGLAHASLLVPADLSRRPPLLDCIALLVKTCRSVSLVPQQQASIRTWRRSARTSPPTATSRVCLDLYVHLRMPARRRARSRRRPLWLRYPLGEVFDALRAGEDLDLDRGGHVLPAEIARGDQGVAGPRGSRAFRASRSSALSKMSSQRSYGSPRRRASLVAVALTPLMVVPDRFG